MVASGALVINGANDATDVTLAAGGIGGVAAIEKYNYKFKSV